VLVGGTTTHLVGKCCGVFVHGALVPAGGTGVVVIDVASVGPTVVLIGPLAFGSRCRWSPSSSASTVASTTASLAVAGSAMVVDVVRQRGGRAPAS